MSLYSNGSCDNAVAVTPSDATVLTPFQSLFVGGAGNVTVTLVSGSDVVFTGVLAGTILPIRGTKVKVATTATNIVAMW